MPPAVGIGFLSLTALLFIAYVVFLIGQNRLQDEVARRCREKEGARVQRGGAAVLNTGLKN